MSKSELGNEERKSDSCFAHVFRFGRVVRRVVLHVPPPLSVLFDLVFDVREAPNLFLFRIAQVSTAFDEHDRSDEGPVRAGAEDEEPKEAL